jgi:hypothetical protein
VWSEGGADETDEQLGYAPGMPVCKTLQHSCNRLHGLLIPLHIATPVTIQSPILVPISTHIRITALGARCSAAELRAFGCGGDSREEMTEDV